MSGINHIADGVVRLPVPGFPSCTVGEDGTVWVLVGTDGGLKKLTTYTDDRTGKEVVDVRIRGKRLSRRVSCLVLESFVGPQPDGFVCAFRNGNVGDSTIDNLFWMDSSLLPKKKAWNHKHGSHTNPMYRIWKNMINRCYFKARKDYKNYGGRGITVCDAWMGSFQQFASDMGQRPTDDASIDRVDVNGHYTPENCRWSNPLQQGRNKRNNRILYYQGESLPMSEWAERFGLGVSTLHVRLSLGWSVADALTRPLKKDRRRTANHSAGGAEKRRMTEMLVTNYEVSS